MGWGQERASFLLVQVSFFYSPGPNFDMSGISGLKMDTSSRPGLGKFPQDILQLWQKIWWGVQDRMLVVSFSQIGAMKKHAPLVFIMNTHTN